MKTQIKKLNIAFYGIALLCLLNSSLKSQTGSALSFTGPDDQVVMSTGSWWNLGSNWTMEIWIKPNSTANQLIVYAGLCGLYCPSWALGIGPEVTCGYGGPSARIVFSSSNGAQVFSDASPATGVWTHVAVTSNGSVMRMYINGIIQNSISQVSGATQNASYIQLGADGPGFCGGYRLPFLGDMDEFRVWNITRTQNQIQTTMNAEIPSTATNLLVNFHFNQGIAGGSNGLVNTLIDATGNTLPSTLNNFVLSGGSSNWVGLGVGGVPNGFTTTTTPTVEINIQGNSNTIVSGNIATSISDFTDFNGAITRTFVIQNTIAGGTLNAGIYVSGIQAPNFSVTSLSSPTIAGIGSASFVISFTPLSGGPKTATVNISNNDADEPLYTFVITASSTAASCLNFDGVNDQVSIPHNNALNLVNLYTFEAWVNPSGTGFRTILSKGDGGGSPGTGEYIFQITGTGQLALYPTFSNGWKYSAPGVVSNNVWSHVAVTHDGSNVKFYVNGALITNSTVINSGVNPGIDPFYIGRQGTLCNCNFMNGSIDEVRVWNVARTQCEIQTFMNSEIPTSASGLVANYHFNQGIPAGVNTTVTSLYDESGSGNNGTLSNLALTGGASNWIIPGGVITGNFTQASLTASISIIGNSNPILNNDFSPSTSDFTNFQSSSTRTFVIQNTGSGLLYLNAISISGANSSEFSITAIPSNTLGTSASGSFVIAFTPTAGGTRSATINITSSDCTNPSYQFAIEGAAPLASALNLDGVNDYVQMPDPNFGTSDCTIETWFNANAGSGYLITTRSFEAGPGGNWWAISIGTGTNSGSVFLELAAASGTYAVINTPPGNFSLNTWNHLAVVRSGSLLNIYINGILKASAVEPVTRNFITGANSLRLGGWPNFNAAWYNGSLDEVRLWNVARNQCQIQTFMNCEIPSTATGLVANYHFNQGAAGLNNSGITTLTDAAGSNNGTLTNFSLLTGTVSNWIAPGSIANGFTTAVAPAATIAVSGNGNNVPQSTATFGSNNTDFGTNATRTFSIYNAGTGTLNINAITFTGLNAAQFSVTTLPLASVTTGTTGFVITLTPTNTGISTATVNISSNDCTNPTFSFVITASTSPASAFNSDGTSYVATSLTLNPTYTKEAWIKLNSGANLNNILSNGNFTAGAGFGAPGFQLQAGHDFGAIHVQDPVALTFGTWYHVAVTYDNATNTMKLYKNGVLVASNYTVPAYSGNFPLQMGAFANANRLNGSIDEVRIWNTVRTQCEILSFMNCEIPTTAPGLLANYHFNQGIPSGTNTAVSTVTDATGNGWTGSLIVAALTGTINNWVSPSNIANDFTTSIVPTASMSITGNGNAIAAGSTAPLLSNFTDFGTASTRTFVIQRTGSGTLYVNAPVTLSGVNASDFSITTQPASSVTTGTTNFVVAFAPTALGTRSAIVVVNSSDCGTPNYSFVITATAVPGAALNFDGVDDYVSITPVFNNQVIDITLQARVYWNGTVANDKFIAHNGNSGSSGYGIYIAGGTNSVNVIYAGINVFYTGYNLTPNQWTALSLVIENNKISFYANSVLINTLTPGVNPAVPSGSFNIGVGVSQGFENFNGKIDEVLFWSRPLNQCEIAAYQNCEIATTASSLIANYHFNQGIASGVNTVTSLSDVSGNNYHLNLNNFALSGLASNWVEPGAVVSGSSCAVYTSPEINLISNATTILDGDSSPSLTDNTDFGNISTNNNIVRTYTIQNTGTATLAVTSITMSGADASSFIVGALSPASPIAGGSSAVFSITFAPTSVGTKTAMVNITNSDCDEGLYDFVLSGTSSVGAALSFDGVNDYVNCGNIISASYTKEAWIKVTNVLSDNNFLSAGTGIVGSALWAPSFAPYNYKLSAGHDATWAAVQDPVALVPGIWYHIAVTYDAPSLTMNLYKNGVLVSSASTVQPFTGTSPLQIGAFGSGFISSGSFDEVRIWNRPLCQAEIQNNMNCEIATTAPGLIANYHFNQGVANGSNTAISSLTDVSGSNNTGTLVTVAGTGTISNWVAVGGVTSGSSCSTYFTPEINLVGNGLSIPDGATTATISNHTNFSVVCVGGTLVRTFTIQNTGNANLTVSSLTMSGSNAALFSVGALTPVSPITPGSQAVFSVSFTPTSSGLKTATLDITNSDCNENPYNVVLTGSCNALPVVTANTSASVICNGQSTTLNGGGADTYTWSGGVPTITNGLAFTPSLTLSYTVSGTNTLTGCTSTNLAVQGITVNPNPTVSAVASSSVICNGASITITPANALSYTLNPGSVSGNSFTLSPSSNTSYSITGTNLNGCVSTNTAVLTITVNALPTVSATSSNSIICLGFTTSVIGLGANTYTWSGGVTNGTAFSPGSTQSYSVSGTNTLTGCTSTNLAVQTISIDPVPSVSVSVTSSAICIGSQATLVASGASTYTWNPGALTGATINPSPSSLTTYTVIGTNLAGCNSTINVLQTIDVNALPTVSASISNSVICAGGSVTVNGSGASTYSWTGSVTDGVSFAPLSSGSYSVSGTSTAGCTSTNNAVVSLTVNALPQLTLSGSTNNTCQGESATLTVNGASSYTWSTSENTNSIVISPTATTLYSVSALDINTCKNTASYTQSVIPCSANFTASALTKNISCAGKNDGQIKILSSSSYSNAAIVYNWNPASLCPANNCDSLTKLKSGIYNVTVKITYTVNASLVKTDSLVMPPIVLTDLSGACEVKIFKGVTANGDGLNDIMTIENITEFPNNKVSVYNRWGQLVYEVKGYNNLDKAWPIKGDEAKLMSNTYFYLIDLGNGTELLKGWIEVIKN